MGRIEFDLSELRGLIIARFGSYKAFAVATNKSQAQISDRLNGKVRIPGDEIYLFSSVLGIPDKHIGRYFFKLKV